MHDLETLLPAQELTKATVYSAKVIVTFRHIDMFRFELF